MHLFAQALHDLDHSQEINTSPLSCDGSETWQHGNSLVNYMKLVSKFTIHLNIDRNKKLDWNGKFLLGVYFNHCTSIKKIYPKIIAQPMHVRKDNTCNCLS